MGSEAYHGDFAVGRDGRRYGACRRELTSEYIEQAQERDACAPETRDMTLEVGTTMLLHGTPREVTAVGNLVAVFVQVRD